MIADLEIQPRATILAQHQNSNDQTLENPGSLKPINSSSATRDLHLINQRDQEFASKPGTNDTGKEDTRSPPRTRAFTARAAAGAENSLGQQDLATDAAHQSKYRKKALGQCISSIPMWNSLYSRIITADTSESSCLNQPREACKLYLKVSAVGPAQFPSQ